MKEVVIKGDFPKQDLSNPKMFMERKTFDHLANEGLTPYTTFNVCVFPEKAVIDPNEWVEVKLVAQEKDKPQ